MATGIQGVVSCILSKDQRQDCVAITELWHQWHWRSIKVVVADKGYDSSAIRAKIKDHGAEPVIPRKGVWVHRTVKHILQTYDVKFYKMRNCIARLFGRQKENKLIATTFDKVDICFTIFVALAILKSFKCLCQQFHK